jgi:hypothetical protein
LAAQAEQVQRSGLTSLPKPAAENPLHRGLLRVICQHESLITSNVLGRTFSAKFHKNPHFPGLHPGLTGVGRAVGASEGPADPATSVFEFKPPPATANPRLLKPETFPLKPFHVFLD